MKKDNTSRSGMVLSVVMIATIVLAILISGALSYSIFAMRSTSSFLADSDCRLAAQSALETIKNGMFQAVSEYNKDYPEEIPELTWFKTSSGETSVGPAGYVYGFPENVVINGFEVNVRRTGNIKLLPETGRKKLARVVLRSTATGKSNRGQDVSKIVEETVDFKLQNNSIFSFAYFAANSGRFSGNKTYINGDAGTNGDFTLGDTVTVNGDIRAALLAWIEGGGTVPNYWSIEEYWKSAPVRARPTDPPNPDLPPDEEFGYDGTAELASGQELLSMPHMGDLSYYKTLATDTGGTISQGGKTLINGTFSGVGPSDDTSATAPDKGSIYLDGSKNPIVLNGLVVVEGDLVISGKVTGQGVIYAGRNIHIIADLTYVNPPGWPKPDADPLNTATVNSGKDMLGLLAMGNVILGNYRSPESNWDSIREDIKTKPPVESNPNDTIGYNTNFTGDYTAYDGLQKVDQVVIDKRTRKPNALPRASKFYESLVDDKIIQTGQSTIKTVDAVMYSNHAILGSVGNTVLNGSILCRDEAIWNLAGLAVNWDERLDYDLPGALANMEFMMSIFPPEVARPEVIGWRELLAYQ